MIIGYVRVSTVEQNDDAQIEIMKKFNVERIYKEKVSAKDMNRKKLKEMLDFAREGDTIVVRDFSRLARNTEDLLAIVKDLDNRKINLISAKEDLNTSTSMGKLLLTIISAIHEFERANLLERQREGIAEAKKRGVYKGRRAVQIEDDKFNKEYSRYLNREINKTELAKVLNISRPTLNKMLKEKLIKDSTE